MDKNFVCNLCNHSGYRVIPFRYAFKGRYINAVKCKKCGLISLFPPPSDDEIQEMYSDDYFTVEDVQTHHYQKDYLTAVKEVDYSQKVNSLRKHLHPQARILEVGCATGELLVALRTEGYEVMGVEISEFAGQIAIKNYGLDVLIAPFEENLIKDDLKEASFDLVLMGDVLEHFKNPTEAMRFSCKLLKPGGVLIVNVPSTLNLISSRIAFLMYRLIGSQKTMTIPPYHLSEFFPRSLRRMYKAAGFSKSNILQETKHPRTITLRHSRLENFLKVVSQYPNYYITRFLGIFGDRLTGIGTK